MQLITNFSEAVAKEEFIKYVQDFEEEMDDCIDVIIELPDYVVDAIEEAFSTDDVDYDTVTTSNIVADQIYENEDVETYNDIIETVDYFEAQLEEEEE